MELIICTKYTFSGEQGLLWHYDDAIVECWHPENYQCSLLMGY